MRKSLHTWPGLLKDVAGHEVAKHTLSDVLIGTRLCCQVGVADITVNRHKQGHIIMTDPAKCVANVVLGTSANGHCTWIKLGAGHTEQL